MDRVGLVEEAVDCASTIGREFHFTDAHFETICRLVGEHTGIRLTDAKRDMVYSRLARRLRQLGLHNFGDYCELVLNPTRGGGELVQLINAITTNLTAFFRENHHFQFLADRALPELMRARRAERRLRFWSAGCSTGEEPYSLAMVLREGLTPDGGWDVRILATDLDSNVLETARRGIYPIERVADLPKARLSRWFLRGSGENRGRVKVKSTLQETVRFRQLNLIGPWPFRRPMDVIFCRNVVIYFSKETQRTLFNRFADALAPDGYLFVGHSESLFKVCDRFELVGNTIYRRVA